MEAAGLGATGPVVEAVGPALGLGASRVSEGVSKCPYLFLRPLKWN